MFKRILNSASILSLILLLGMMNMLTPSEAGPFGVLVFFTLFYVLCFWLASFLVQSFFNIRWRIKGKRGLLVNKKMYYYSSILAFAPVILLAIQSFGGVSYLEVFLVLILVLMGCFYVSKRA